MDQKEKVAKSSQLQLRGAWKEPSDLGLVFVDELFVQIAKDRAYLTFGQAHLPLANKEDNATLVEIRPMARFVTSRDSLMKMIDVLQQVLKQGHQE